jgi:dienelactone hydrolase
MKKIILFAFVFITTAALAQNKEEPRAIVGGEITYKIGDQEFEGFLARPAKTDGRGPAILIVHDWMGAGDFGRDRANVLAQRGYVAFAVDLYGKGVRAGNAEEAGKLAGALYKDRTLMRTRLQGALAELTRRDDVDPKRVGIMGFCFGGSAALELARSGADIRAVVSFHGGLTTPTPADAKNIKAKLLILHGALDPLVPPADVAAFMTEMNAAKIPYRLVAYPGAVHAFTNPAAGDDPSKPTAYNADVAMAAYREMFWFFEQALK